MSSFHVHLGLIPRKNEGRECFRLPCACTLTHFSVYITNGAYRTFYLSNKVRLLSASAANWADTGTPVSIDYTLSGVNMETPIINTTDFAGWTNQGVFKEGDMIFLDYAPDSLCKGCYMQATLVFTTN